MNFTAIPIEDRDDIEFMYFGCRLYALMRDLITEPDALRKFDLLFNILKPVVIPALTLEERQRVDSMLEMVLSDTDSMLTHMPDQVRAGFDLFGIKPEAALEHMKTMLQKTTVNIPDPDPGAPMC